MPEKREAYLCISAMLRAKESLLLSAEKAERMLDSPSFEDAAKLLTDCGYEDMSQLSAVEIDSALSRHRLALLRELERFGPADGITDFFRIKYDYHNAKVVLKSEAQNTDTNRLYSEAGRIGGEELAALYAEEKYSSMPGLLGKALAEAGQVLARSSNPQIADFVLDRAYFDELHLMADKIGSDYLKSYAAMLTDVYNLKSTVRTMRMGKSADFLDDVLAKGGKVEPYRFLGLSAADLPELFNHTKLERAAHLGAAAVSGEGRLSDFEKECDNAINSHLKSAKLVGYGAEPVIAFLAAKENEITTVRMILTGLRTGISPDRIRERLRDGYA